MQLIKDRERNLDTNENIDAELVHLLYSQAKSGIIASFIVATIMILALYKIIPLRMLLGWYGLMAIVAVSRYSLVTLYFQKNSTPQQGTFWRNLFIAQAAFSGVAWSFLGTVLFPENGTYQTLIASVLAGVSGGGIPFFAASRAACIAYTAPMLLPFAAHLLLLGNVPHQLLGMFVLLYLSLLITSAFRSHRAIYHAINLKLQNSKLVADLSATKEQMESINNVLNDEIEERKVVEKLLRESEEQYRLVTDALPVLISYVDNDLHYRFNNKAHEIWLGKEMNEITGKHIKDIIGNTAYAIFMENYEKLAEKKQITFETIMQFRDEERYVSVTLIPHKKDGLLTGFFSLISDMTPRMNYLATHDALTDLPNRSLFTARFSQALKRAHRRNYQVALLFLDLDHFKTINDTMGHDVGDHLLVNVAERIKGCLREIDTLARLGGDEFTIILEDITSENIVKISNKICEVFSNPFHVDGRDVFITTSIGISIYPEDGTDMQLLIKNADMAIYRAKDNGRNKFEFYTDDLNKKMINKLNTEANLRSAMENQELLLYYQPIFDLVQNRISSLEALLRWQHPDTGLIPPDQFIPVAEEVGLIVPIGRWILRNACMQKIKWEKTGNFPLDVRISVNMSARQFKENNLAENIKIILEETELSGEGLVLELTESMLMHNIDHSAETIKSLKDLGIHIAIDDFGMGYSSLNYLRRFPIDVIKIDRSFISDLHINPDGAAIVNAIIAMAHSLKMKVIAEGVETLEQYHFLKERGCDQIQGFLISKPLPPVGISTFLQNAFSLEQMLEREKASQIKTS